MAKFKKIAILTSGGDAPGMNACIRAVTLAGLAQGLEIIGFKHGYNGLLNDEWITLDEPDVRHLIHQGGTLLKSARCKVFPQVESVKTAAKVLEKNAVDALFVIGGNGSFQGAVHLSNYWSGQIIGLPGTIDNDIDGTDTTIGFHTATDTALDAIDKIRDTADAFERIFIVEVMGRDSGFLAVNIGIASGAEQIISPELCDIEQLALSHIADKIRTACLHRHDSSYIIVLAENYWPGGASALAKELNSILDSDCRPCVLGYIQRGGKPVSEDRILATKLGVAAVEAAKEGKTGIMIGQVNAKISEYPLICTNEQTKMVDSYLLKIQKEVLSDI